MTTFSAPAPAPSASAPAPARPGRDAGAAGAPDESRLRQAAQAAARRLGDVQGDIAHHEGWAAQLQSRVGQMTGEERVTQEALVAAVNGRLETLRGRRARLEADLGRLQRPDLARPGDRSAMEDLARLVQTYAGGVAAPAHEGESPASARQETFDLCARPDIRAEMPRSRRLPPIARAEEVEPPRGRRRRLSVGTILRMAALMGFLALLLFAFGSEPNGVAEPGEEARFMASNGSSHLPQINSTPGAGGFPGIQFPMPALPLPGQLQSGAPNVPSSLPGLSLPGGLDLNRLPELLPRALSAARQAL